jgi:hypothetical protein
MNRSGKIVTAFAVGATAGAVLGLLLAPAKRGEKMKSSQEEKGTRGEKGETGRGRRTESSSPPKQSEVAASQDVSP